MRLKSIKFLSWTFHGNFGLKLSGLSTGDFGGVSEIFEKHNLQENSSTLCVLTKKLQFNKLQKQWVQIE